MSMRWYVVHAYSGYEKKVAIALQDRVELHGLQARFGEVLVPTIAGGEGASPSVSTSCLSVSAVSFSAT